MTLEFEPGKIPLVSLPTPTPPPPKGNLHVFGIYFSELEFLTNFTQLGLLCVRVHQCVCVSGLSDRVCVCVCEYVYYCVGDCVRMFMSVG